RMGTRWRRALTTTVSTVVAKGLSVLTGLISVPITMKYLGAERYGVWMTVSSAVILLVFADLGLGNGVVNAGSPADGSDNRRRAHEVVSNAFFLLAGLAVGIAALFAALFPLVSWHVVFNVTSPAARLELPATVAVVFGCFVISLPLGLVQRVQIGYQEGY